MSIRQPGPSQTLQPPINAIAKPAMKAVSWTMVAVGAAALTLAGIRTVRSGE